MSLIDRLIKNSTIDETSTLDESKIYGKSDMIPTPVPMINVALSGSIDGGLTPGLTILAGPSKHFKSGFSLLMASAFLKKYPEGVILFYDSEFGTPQGYFDTFGIPIERVVHTPITDVEQLKHDVMQQLNNIGRDDKVCIIIDSVGNLASKKEVDDALEGKSVADMSRAKALKSLFRMVTPHLTLKDLPMIVVNHTYKEMALYRKSGASNDALTNSLRNEALTTSLLNSDSHQKRNVRINDSHNEIQVSSRTPSAIDHLANSQDTSDKMKRSMTVILEEDMEDSNLNFT